MLEIPGHENSFKSVYGLLPVNKQEQQVFVPKLFVIYLRASRQDHKRFFFVMDIHPPENLRGGYSTAVLSAASSG